MTDRELLELAAKAAGFLNWTPYNTGLFVETGHSRGSTGYHWNPLTDDGDALRLAVKLGMSIEVHTDLSQPKPWLRIVYADSRWEHVSPEDYDSDPYAATRRAIVRAAAEIGRNMK